jgi:hypothetical protein
MDTQTFINLIYPSVYYYLGPKITEKELHYYFPGIDQEILNYSPVARYLLDRNDGKDNIIYVRIDETSLYMYLYVQICRF